MWRTSDFSGVKQTPVVWSPKTVTIRGPGLRGAGQDPVCRLVARGDERQVSTRSNRAIDMLVVLVGSNKVSHAVPGRVPGRSRP